MAQLEHGRAGVRAVHEVDLLPGLRRDLRRPQQQPSASRSGASRCRVTSQVRPDAGRSASTSTSSADDARAARAAAHGRGAPRRRRATRSTSSRSTSQPLRDKLAHVRARAHGRTTSTHETPILRGVYFTSGTQEGRPLNRIMNAMAEALRHPAEAADDRAAGRGEELLPGRPVPEA